MLDVYSRPGSLAAIWTINAVPAMFDITGRSLLPPLKVLITSATTSYGVNIQFQNTLSDYIYVYLFNHRMGQMQIQGLTFANPCRPFMGNGSDYVFAFYATFNAIRIGTPIAVVIGTTAYAAYLVGMTQGITDAEHGIGKFGLTLAIIP